MGATAYSLMALRSRGMMPNGCLGSPVLVLLPILTEPSSWMSDRSFESISGSCPETSKRGEHLKIALFLKYSFESLTKAVVEARASAHEEPGHLTVSSDDDGLRNVGGAVALGNTAIGVQGNGRVELEPR